MFQFYLYKKECNNGGSGIWLKIYNDDDLAIGLWLSLGCPLWRYPRIIWMEMNEDGVCKTLLDVGLGWLFACFRVVIQYRID